MGENGQRKEKGHAGLPHGRVGGEGEGLYRLCLQQDANRDRDLGRRNARMTILVSPLTFGSMVVMAFEAVKSSSPHTHPPHLMHITTLVMSKSASFRIGFYFSRTHSNY